MFACKTFMSAKALPELIFSGTMTVGTRTFTNVFGKSQTDYGYERGIIGSLTGDTLIDGTGNHLVELSYLNCPTVAGITGSLFQLANASYGTTVPADPYSGYSYDIVVDGITYNTGSAYIGTIQAIGPDLWSLAGKVGHSVPVQIYRKA